jgi:hypothetical protein
MEGLAVVALIGAFLPFFVSLGGRGGVWKFLSFLFCCFALVGAASLIGFGGGVLAWIIAWIFAAIAAQSRRSEERFFKMEQNMLAAKANEETSSPVGRLLQAGSEKRSFRLVGTVCQPVARLWARRCVDRDSRKRYQVNPRHGDISTIGCRSKSSCDGSAEN